MSEAHSVAMKAMATKRTSQDAQNEEDTELLNVIRKGPSVEYVRDYPISAVKSLENDGKITKAIARQWINNINGSTTSKTASHRMASNR